LFSEITHVDRETRFKRCTAAAIALGDRRGIRRRHPVALALVVPANLRRMFGVLCGLGG
jgi:hypothetical protein